MSVLIKDIEKPKSCYAVIDGESEYCPFVNTDDDCVLQLKKGICEGTWEDQYSKCPLIEAPEPCEDAVSREAVTDVIRHSDIFSTWCEMDDTDDIVEEVIDEARKQLVDDVNELPSVTPKCPECDDAVSREAAIDAALSAFSRGLLASPDIRKLPSVQPEWNNHTVACLLAELFDDTCACNYNGIDEWLPSKCELLDSCPNPVGVACWEQFLKHRAERRTISE